MSSAAATTQIEINGVKFEIDLRHAKRVDELRVGDRVKVLTKKYDGYEVHAGTVIGFEPFEKLPTIIVAYVTTGFDKAEITFVHFNAQSKDVEIVKAIDDDNLDLSRANVVAAMDRMIAKKQAELDELVAKKSYFLRQFRAYWAPVSAPIPVSSEEEPF